MSAIAVSGARPLVTGPLALVEDRMRELVVTGDDATSAAGAHHLQAGGKRVRARLALAAAATLGLPTDAAVAIAAGVELLHNATLVHDDLQDRDTHRRGQPAVWTVWGDDVAICLGDLMLSGSSAALVRAGGDVAALVRRTHERVGALVRGQVLDCTPGGATDVVGYEAIAAGKSGPLLGLPLELPLLWAGHHDAVAVAATAADRFAVGYQAADDLGDVEGDRRAGRPNLVNLFADAGDPAPARRAAAHAATAFRTAATLARSLPSGSGEPLAVRADDAVARLLDVSRKARS